MTAAGRLSGLPFGMTMTKDDCEALRREIKAVADRLSITATTAGNAEPSEAYANAKLAYRHLEDASMRLGKAIQALDGGTSVYDKTQVPNVLSKSDEEECR